MKQLFFFITVICFILYGCRETASKEGIRDLHTQAFREALDNAPGQLIDVRTPEEFNQSHLAGAENINVNEPDFINLLSRLDKNKTVYVYCRSGGRSSKAAGIMQEQGFTDIVNLSGGITDWSEAGLPVTRD